MSLSGVGSGRRKGEVRIVGPANRTIAMQRQERGYHRALVENVVPGTQYGYRLDGQTEKPDPASRHQPGGVHGPSEVVDLAFKWEDAGWIGLDLADYIIYEFSDEAATAVLPFPKASFRKIMESADQRWHGGGSLCPDLLEADGNASLSIAPSSLVLFQSN